MLGTGTFAVVYRAHDPTLGIDVAVKVLAEPHAHDPVIRARFLTDAQTLRQLSDDRIVTVHDIGEFDGRPFLAVELVDGGTLEDLLRDGQTLPTVEIEWLVAGLGAALVVVHAAGFVHRDIRPSNVLIRHGGAVDQLVLADFGVARDVDQVRLTIAAGTDGFLAPEQRVPGADSRRSSRRVCGVRRRRARGVRHRLATDSRPQRPPPGDGPRTARHRTTRLRTPTRVVGQAGRSPLEHLRVDRSRA